MTTKPATAALFDEEVWSDVDNDDLWLFDKLIVSRKLGHLCGPAFVEVPKPDYYIVRPCVNLGGMGIGAEIVWINKSTEHLPAGYFWQEIFTGRHLSVDFKSGKQVRCTEGIREENDLTKWKRWFIVDDHPEIPQPVKGVISKYYTVNVEMIGGHIIEVHLRGNPDFDDGALECIPVWIDDEIYPPEGYLYVEDNSFHRKGFYKRY